MTDDWEYYDYSNPAYGGAIYNGNAYNCTFKTCYINDRLIGGDNYVGGGHGGAIYAGNAFNSTFINCSSWSGGAISNGDANKCLFETCYTTPSDGWGGQGGAIESGNAYNSTFIECNAECEGGAIYNGASFNSNFIDCNAWSGGAIYDGTAYDSRFLTCAAKQGSAISGNFYIMPVNYVNAYNCYFEKCSSDGGVIYYGNTYDCKFIDCTPANSKLIINGNAINCTSNVNTLICSDLIANYGEPVKSPITTVEGINGMPVTVKLYKDGKLTNTFSAITGSDVIIEAIPGNYILALSCVGGDPLNVSLTVNKGSPKLAFATDFAKSGETANIKVTMSKKAAGYARISINGETYRVQIKSGTATAEVPDLADGVYDVTATYGGNVYHTAETITGTFQVGKINQGINVETQKIEIGEILVATLAKDATGFVRFIIANETYKVPIENGAAYQNVTDFKTGTYKVTLKYGGNYRYNAETVTKTLNITQEGDFNELSTLIKGTAPGKTLKLEKGYINDGSSKEIKISKAITIDGQGNTIDANKKSNIFRINVNNVVLKNINFINSYSDLYSAIHGYKCSIINCSFTECSAWNLDYMIYSAIDGSDAYNCTFTNCISMGSTICNGNAYNCTFTNCVSNEGGGGAIYHGNAYNCTFTKCSAAACGGAIDYGNAYNCTFVDCYVGEGYILGGGAIYYGIAYNCTFKNCSSEQGGAISVGNAYNSTFIDCSAAPWGGAICDGNAYNCTFTNCSALYSIGYYDSGSGGAIFEGNAYNCTFRECSADETQGKGGAIYNGNAYDSLFVDCSAAINKIIYNGTTYNCTIIPFTFSCSDLTVNYGEGGKLQIKTLEGNNGIPILVKIYKDNKLINSFASSTGSDLPIDAAPGNYIIALTCEYADPLNVSVTVNKGSPKMTLANDYAKSGETANVKISMSKKATGFARITINGETYRVQISSGVASVDVPNLADGAYTVKATYSGNSYHTAETMTATFHVGKFSQGMEITTENIKVGDTERIIANMAKDATGFVRFIIGNDTYKVAIENGVAYVDLKDLKAGSYSVTIKYGGNYKYLAETKTASFNVSKSSPELKVFKTTVDGKTVLTANIAKDATGNVNFLVNGNTYKAKITNGVATLTLPDMAPGTYTLKSTYNGNYKYLAETKTRSITIK